MHSVLNESASMPVAPAFKASVFDPPTSTPAANYSSYEVTSKKLSKRWQRLLDESSTWYKTRWASFFIALFLYAWRVYTLKGFHIISYMVGIFVLNRFIGFLSPAGDVAQGEAGGRGENESLLPLSNNEEFRPFLRMVPEFDFWFDCMRSMVLALTATFFPILDLPVFWPILLVYWFVLFVIMMKGRIDHMLKHRYVPFSIGKRTYEAAATTKTDAASAAIAAGVRRL